MNADFIIPFLMDSEDRLRNLFRAVIYLSNSFPNNKIYIINQTYLSNDGHIYQYIDEYKLHHNVIVHSVDIPMPCYKTKLINIGINLVQKNSVIMYDCDVLIPKEQLELSVELCDKGYALVYPYSNPQYNVNQYQFSEFQNNYDFVELQKIIEPYQIPHLHQKFRYPIIGYSPGFCLTLNKRELGNHIYYNEEFRSPQFEDAEYIFKMDFLKMKMTRVYGPVFHFQHERVVEVKYPDIIQNNKRIYENIMSMNSEQLTNYYIKEHK